MRFFSWSSSKDIGYFVGNFGVAASLAVSEFSTRFSAISGGIGLFGNTLNFTAENSENLAISSIKKQLDELLENQLTSNGFSLEDCCDEFPWSSCLKEADALLKKKIPYFHTMFEAALGIVGGILCLAVNASRDENGENKHALPCSVIAGTCIGIQSCIHYFTSRQFTKLRREIANIHNALSLLAKDERFLLWKFTVLEQKKSALQNKLMVLEEESEVFAGMLMCYQVELNQKLKLLQRFAVEGSAVQEKLREISMDMADKNGKLSLISNLAISETGHEKVRAQTELRAEIADLEKKQQHEGGVLQNLQIRQRSANQKYLSLEQRTKEIHENSVSKAADIAMVRLQCEKISTRIFDLRSQLETFLHEHENRVNSIRSTFR